MLQHSVECFLGGHEERVLLAGQMRYCSPVFVHLPAHRLRAVGLGDVRLRQDQTSASGLHRMLSKVVQSLHVLGQRHGISFKSTLEVPPDIVGADLDRSQSGLSAITFRFQRARRSRVMPPDEPRLVKRKRSHDW